MARRRPAKSLSRPRSPSKRNDALKTGGGFHKDDRERRRQQALVKQLSEELDAAVPQLKEEAPDDGLFVLEAADAKVRFERIDPEINRFAIVYTGRSWNTIQEEVSQPTNVELHPRTNDTVFLVSGEHSGEPGDTSPMNAMISQVVFSGPLYLRYKRPRAGIIHFSEGNILGYLFVINISRNALATINLDDAQE